MTDGKTVQPDTLPKRGDAFNRTREGHDAQR